MKIKIAPTLPMGKSGTNGDALYFTLFIKITSNDQVYVLLYNPIVTGVVGSNGQVVKKY